MNKYVVSKGYKDFFKSDDEIWEDENLTLNEKALMRCLFRFYNCEKGYAYPTYEMIMKNCGFRRRATVSATIKGVVKKGYIEVIKTVGNRSLYFIKKHLYLQEPKTVNKDIEVEADKKQSKTTDKKAKKANKKQPKKSTKAPKNNDVNDVVPFTREHQSKISLLVKFGVKLTEKQRWLLGEFDFETLREALRTFRRKSRTNSFSFLISCYYIACNKFNIIPSMDIQRYSGNMFFKETKESKDYRDFMSEIEEVYA